MLGMKAASDEPLNLWGMLSIYVSSNMIDVMSQLSKDGTVVYPKGDQLDMKLLAAKYSIYQDMAVSQTRYRREIDGALV